MNYYGYGYSQNAGYESYHYPNYNYYPGMESSGGVDKANSIPSDQRTNSYGYNYNTYGDEAQQYNYDSTQAPFYNNQNPSQN